MASTKGRWVMESVWDRRSFVGSAAAAAMVVAGSIASAAQAAEVAGPPWLVLGIAASPRRGKTTARAVEMALEGVRSAGAGLRTELIDLGGMRISGWTPEPSGCPGGGFGAGLDGSEVCPSWWRSTSRASAPLPS